MLADGQLFREATRLMLELGGEATLYGGIESRGLVFAAAMATRAERGLVMIRKHGKLPPPTHRREYTLEYGTDMLEMAPCPAAGTSLLLVDDLLATGRHPGGRGNARHAGGVSAGRCRGAGHPDRAA